MFGKKKQRPLMIVGDQGLQVPDDWHGLPTPRLPPGWVEGVMHEVVESAPTRPDEDRLEQLRTAVAATGGPLVADTPLIAAVWVPWDTIALAGWMTLELITPIDVDRITVDYLRELATTVAPDHFDLINQSVTEVELPVGPALRVEEIVAAKSDGTVQEQVFYLVVPRGCDEGLRLGAMTHETGRSEQLAEAVEHTAQTLRVEVRPE